MARVDELFSKMDRLAPKPKQSKKRHRKRVPRPRYEMEKSFMAPCTRPDASLVTTSEDAEVFIRKIDDQLEKLRQMNTSSTESAEKRLSGWKRGWIKIKRRMETDFSDSYRR